MLQVRIRQGAARADADHRLEQGPRCSPPAGGAAAACCARALIGNRDRIAVPYWRRGAPGLERVEVEVRAVDAAHAAAARPSSAAWSANALRSLQWRSTSCRRGDVGAAVADDGGDGARGRALLGASASWWMFERDHAQRAGAVRPVRGRGRGEQQDGDQRRQERSGTWHGGGLPLAYVAAGPCARGRSTADPNARARASLERTVKPSRRDFADGGRGVAERRDRVLGPRARR